MKKISLNIKGSTLYTSIAIICFALVLSFSTRSCENSQPTETKKKADHSFIIDSLKRIETARLKKQSDSLIYIHEKKDSIAEVKYTKLEKGYNAQRSIIKHLAAVKVDSFNQVVIVPVIEYNTLVESGNKCDSMNVINKERIIQKDSINSELKGQVRNEQEQNIATTQALSDQRALTAEEKQKGEKSKKLNKILFKIVVIETAIIAIVAIVL